MPACYGQSVIAGSKQAWMPALPGWAALPGSLPYSRAAKFIISGRRDRHEGSGGKPLAGIKGRVELGAFAAIHHAGSLRFDEVNDPVFANGEITIRV